MLLFLAMGDLSMCSHRYVADAVECRVAIAIHEMADWILVAVLGSTFTLTLPTGQAMT